MHRHDSAMEMQNLKAKDLLVDGNYCDPSPFLMSINNPKGVKSEKAEDFRDVNGAKEVNSPEAITNLTPEVSSVTLCNPESVDYPRVVGNPLSLGNTKSLSNIELVHNLDLVSNPESVDKPISVDNPDSVGNPESLDNRDLVGNLESVDDPDSVDNRELVGNPESVDNPEVVGDSEVVGNQELADATVGSKEAKTPKAGKKRKSETKRQWAAWTRQEEENFFNALRQVGKNFEKITRRVETKNKNQVRHYYYRLVRRMNKLLGPGILIDARNPRDTNAAMLRWWSLLEKQSCAASKLRLKPRRFKIFLETLESQLMKDRNKSRRKRPGQGEKYSSTTLIPPFNKELGNNCNPIVDDTNTAKVETSRNSPSKRTMKPNNVNSNGSELPPKIPPKKKRKAGLVASAAYRRWEKAAKAGVSLVADAAAQFERTNNERNSFLMSNGKNNGGQNNIGAVHNEETIVQPPVKLKLQLFPIDELTRQALEKDACNPYLELTISGRKRFSSVFEHLNRKWGCSSIATGELMLLPFNSHVSCTDQQKWTKETNLSAAEVYATVGCPAIFRLRYGWFSNAEPHLNVAQSHPLTTLCDITMQGVDIDASNKKILGTAFPPSEKPGVEQEEEANLENRNTVSAVEWADSLTNISVGDLLSEASKDAKCVGSSPGDQEYPLDDPFSCDSFDAVIAAHTSRMSTHASHTSMWNADETCDEFSFKQMPTSHKSRDNTLSRFADINERTFVVSGSACGGSLKELAEPGPSSKTNDTEKDDGPSKGTNLMDIYWPDSLGAFDLDVPTVPKFPGQDLIFGDSNSIGFLSRIVSNSLDAFQSCSLFGLDKVTSTSEAK